MGFFKSLTSNGGAPAFPPSHTPGETVNTDIPPEAQSQASSQAAPPPGWFIQWAPSHRKIYYLEQETGRTQWVCPNMKNAPPKPKVYEDDDGASVLSGTTAVSNGPAQQSRGPHPVHWKGAKPDRVQYSHLWMNLPTSIEREKMTKAAAEKREKEGLGPPGPETSGQKMRRKFHEANEFAGHSGIF